MPRITYTRTKTSFFIKSDPKKQLMMKEIDKDGKNEESGGISWTLLTYEDHGSVIISTLYQYLIPSFSLKLMAHWSSSYSKIIE